MANEIPNIFTSYALTDKESLAGSVLTIGQKQVIQNHLAILAQEKLALEFDVANPETFIQAEAYKKGQIDILSYLLDESESAVNILAKG